MPNIENQTPKQDEFKLGALYRAQIEDGRVKIITFKVLEQSGRTIIFDGQFSLPFSRTSNRHRTSELLAHLRGDSRHGPFPTKKEALARLLQRVSESCAGTRQYLRKHEAELALVKRAIRATRD